MCFFVIRHRDNLFYSQIEERSLPETRAQNVLIDEIIELTGEQTLVCVEAIDIVPILSISLEAYIYGIVHFYVFLGCLSKR